MVVHIRNRSTTFQDHCLRTSSLLDLARSQVVQSRYLLSVIQLSYPNLYASWSEWGCALASLQHQMEEQSQSFALMARTASKHTDAQKISLSRAYEIYLRLFAERGSHEDR